MAQFEIKNGNLVDNPTMGKTEGSEDLYADFTIAENHGKDFKKVSYFNCRAYKGTAERIRDNFQKGDKIQAEGAIFINLVKKDDKTNQYHQVTINRVTKPEKLETNKA